MRWLLLIWFVLVSSFSFAYDTLRISLGEAEEIFLKRNLFLLAEQYNVEAQSALIIQSRLWANPRITAEINAYNPERDRYFDDGKSGQKAVAIEQLILLGGKRKNQIAVVKQQANLASYELEDLLRKLKFQLRKSFYSIYYDEQTLNRYSRQLQLLSSIISAYQIQGEKGNIPLKEVLRLKAIYYQLNSDKTELINNILNEEETLKVMVQEQNFIEPLAQQDVLDNYQLNALLESDLGVKALSNRPDYKLAQGNADLADLNLRLQHSLAVPDVTLGGSYDQRGGAFHNQVGLTMGIDLPVLNRNQGNIRYSQFRTQSARLVEDNKKLQIQNEVATVLQKLIRVDEEYKMIDQSFTHDFESLNEGIIKNFQKRNISLLEFVDFFVSYNESLRELNRLRKSRIQAYEELNTTVASELFK
jgi:outer membrane protein, heavy metal efflux system